MKREMKLIYLLLAYVEQAQNTGSIPLPEFPDYRKCEIRYHVLLCEEAGYLEILKSERGKPVAIDRLTWNGHESLVALRQTFSSD